MEFVNSTLSLLFFVSILAGFIDAAAGGGGLITIPTLILNGVPPLQALATNKFQGTFGSFFSSIYFFRSGYIELNRLPTFVFYAAIGSITGCMMAIFLGNDSLLVILPPILSGLALYLLFSKNIGATHKPAKISDTCYAKSAGLIISFYDGFIGPGTGSFFALSLVKLLGLNYVKATAYAKVLNFTSNFIALLFFLFFGYVIFSYGLVMAFGQMIGATLGSKVAINQGTHFIRILTVIMCIALSIKIIMNQFF